MEELPSREGCNLSLSISSAESLLMKQRCEHTAELVFHAVSQSLTRSLSFHSVFLSKTRFPGMKGAGFFLCGKSDLSPVSQNSNRLAVTLSAPRREKKNTTK